MNNIKFTAFSGTKNNKFTERNTNTIKNNNLRKLTSIALMTIMVAGGLTFAIPGMEPAEAAQIDSNPNLKVSAEGQNSENDIGATNIVEVVIIDELTDESGNRPIVKVDDKLLQMYFFSGAWYGYQVLHVQKVLHLMHLLELHHPLQLQTNESLTSLI